MKADVVSPPLLVPQEGVKDDGVDTATTAAAEAAAGQGRGGVDDRLDKSGVDQGGESVPTCVPHTCPVVYYVPCDLLE